MLSKQQINKIITNYCKEHNIRKGKHKLYPLYIHLNGFSHSIGFTSRKVKKGERATTYTSVGYSAYTQDTFGYENEHQRYLAYTILSLIPHYRYQNNAQEILF